MRLGKGLLTVVVLHVALYAAAGEVPDAPSAILTRSPASLPSPLLPSPDAAEFAPAPVLNLERPKPRKVVDGKFLFLTGLATGLTVADYEMTQSCMARHLCKEADPLLPHSRVGMYGTNIPLNAAAFWWSYKRKAAGKRLWWLPPLAIAASHAIGVGTNIRFLK